MATWPTDLDPEYEWVETYRYSTVQTEFDTGDVQTRAKWHKARRLWTLRWNHAPEDEAETLRAFYRERVGAAGEFSYTPVDKVPRPHDAPTLGTDTGGSLGSRTLHSGFTWSDTSNETTRSIETDSLALTDGYVLTVTVPEFPAGVTEAIVYVGTSASVLYEQATAISTSGGTWTEPVTGYATGTDNPPTSNTLTETPTAHFIEDSISIAKLNAKVYSMAVQLEELF
jgi:hypothetical protein